MSVFNDYQLVHMAHLASKLPTERCYCGWTILPEKCYGVNCVEGKTYADYLAEKCVLCGQGQRTHLGWIYDVNKPQHGFVTPAPSTKENSDE